MGNTLKMEKQMLIKQLIAAGWSDRKIHNRTGLNRRTVSSYRKKFKKESEAERVNATRNNGCGSTSPGEA
ncbi:helix-turn-helix domain-containing protein [Fidelibacter multiformis]|uniref:helix-turn-helix domain-containing protein n=1 Tax=Fidelibacter multiformis TaxID=3377529 RepID=UPI0037DCB85A